MAVFPKHKTGEVLGLLFLCSSLLLVLSLVGYHSLDPSLNVSSSTESYSNYAGKFGSYLSDFLFQLFGLAAFFLPAVLLLYGVCKILGRAVEYPYVQILGICFSLLALCSGLFLVGPWLPIQLEFAAGGAVGILLGSLLKTYLNTAGALVVVMSVLTVALVLTTSFSFERLLGWMAGRQWRPFASLRHSLAEWRKRRRDRREVRRLQQEKAQLVTEAPPRKLVLDTESGSTSPSRSVSAKPSVIGMEQSPATVTPKVEEVGTFIPYRLPSLDFLHPAEDDIVVDEDRLIEQAARLTEKYAEFDIHGRVLQIHPGPVVTTFEFKPDPGIKYSRVTNLADDLCLGLKAESIRIDRIPGKNTVGIEVPNATRQVIRLRELFSSAAYQDKKSFLTLGLGKLINGNTFVADLADMPHLLIAGSTGSGKSVAINCLICSILYKASPEDVKLILVDPKRLELGLYSDIPHLLTPIVTDPKEAANALHWAVKEMEERYRLLAKQGVRDLAHYNKVVQRLPEPSDPEEEKLEPLPMIVIIVDELADLMMTSGKEVEMSLARLAQMARAVGIHLILATQRPSVDILTGLIKNNFPCRISFRVTSKFDSRTILDCVGAEHLLGQGDMLFLSPRTARPIRLHGGLITEEEVKQITSFLRQQAEPEYREEILQAEEETEGSLVDVKDLEDPLYEEAAQFIVETRKASTSLLQRRLRIGYGRAARLLDIMEHEGIVGPPDGSRPREVLVPPDYFTEIDRDD